MLNAILAVLIILNALMLSAALGLLLAMTASAIKEHERIERERCGYDPHTEAWGDVPAGGDRNV